VTGSLNGKRQCCAGENCRKLQTHRSPDDAPRCSYRYAEHGRIEMLNKHTQREVGNGDANTTPPAQRQDQTALPGASNLSSGKYIAGEDLSSSVVVVDFARGDFAKGDGTHCHMSPGGWSSEHLRHNQTHICDTTGVHPTSLPTSETSPSGGSSSGTNGHPSESSRSESGANMPVFMGVKKEHSTSEQDFLRHFFSLPMIQAYRDQHERRRQGRQGQPASIDSLLRRWLAVRGSRSAAGRVADQVAPHFDRANFGGHLPLLGSAALLQLANDTANSLVSIGAEVGGFLQLLVHVGVHGPDPPRAVKIP
jgi:hypothetical protein